jgi:hypothetical protein
LIVDASYGWQANLFASIGGASFGWPNHSAESGDN